MAWPQAAADWMMAWPEAAAVPMMARPEAAAVSMMTWLEAATVLATAWPKKKPGGGMTECAKMKLRKKPRETSIWTKIKIFYITLFFLSIITLVVNYEDGRNWLMEFYTLNLTSQDDSSVRT